MYNYADRMKNLSGNAIREIFKLLQNPEVVSFAGGMPANDALPLEQIKNYTNELLSLSNAKSLLQYGATEGLFELRQNILEYVKRCGIENQAVENTQIVSGGQQGIDLTMKAFINKDDVVLVENPTYLAVLHILKTYQAKIIGVESDDDGINLQDLQQKIEKYNPKIFYVVPNFSNPAGKTLSLEKRKKIAEIAAAAGIVVLEDDPYRELRYSGQPLPSIKSFDVAERIIYLTSFSKSISPALRVGAVIANSEIIRKLTIGKQATDVHTALLNQAVINKFLSENMLDKIVAAAIPIYKQKKDAMIEAIKKYFPPCEYTNPDGGLFIFVKFDGINCKQLFMRAVEECKSAYVCGSDFYADSSGENTIRLNFSNASIENIEKGIERLGRLFSASAENNK